MQGPVGGFEPCDGNDPDCLEPTLGVQLVR
jgi:hypothetical protein